MRKLDLFGIGITVTTYHAACDAIIEAGLSRRSFAATALAVHGVVEGISNPSFAQAVNSIDLVTPDGQPVRWALNLLHHAGLKDRVCGPDLAWLVCQTAARHGVPIYVYGSTAETCARLVANLGEKLPGIRIAGVQPDRFREATHEEDMEDIERINRSGAGIVLVGRGCPRQEWWVARHKGKVHAAMLAVGAAFDFHAGTTARAPRWMRASGLEWLFRLVHEPRRLARRYTITNGRFLYLLTRELVRHPLRI